MKKFISALFFLCLTLDVIFIATQKVELRIFTKNLLMPLIILWYIKGVKKLNISFLLAILFSWFGDILLLDSQNYFTYGLFSFLLTHVLYISILIKLLKEFSAKTIIKCSIPFVIIFTGIFYLIFKNLSNSLIAPVLIYGTAISVFGTLSLVNLIQNKTKLSYVLFIGTILFVISDSLLTLNKFYIESIVLRILVIVFYGVSQFLIAKAMTMDNKK